MLTSLLAALGYLLYRLGVYREAGIVQHASNVTGDLLRWPLMGTVLLVVVMAVSAMTAERHARRFRPEPWNQPPTVFHGQAALTAV